MENKTLNSVESIELIQRMITATHDRFTRGGGNFFLIWGYTTLFFALLVTLLSQLTNMHHVNYLWWGIPGVGTLLSLVTLRREKNRTPQVHTFVDRCIAYIWLTIGTIAVLYPLVGFINPMANFMLVPTEAMLMSIGAILTGLIIRFRPITIGGIVALIFGFAMFFFDQWYLYLFMGMIVCAIIVPGHILNYKGKCSNR